MRNARASRLGSVQNATSTTLVAAADRAKASLFEGLESRVLLAFSAYVNFAPSGTAAYGSYVLDTGAAYADRGNGLTYGWNAANNNTRSRAAGADIRYKTFNHMQKNGTFSWEIAVPNGTYSVKIAAGDADYFDSTYKINAEGTLIVNGTPTSSSRWVEGTGTVTVSDGKLTVSNATGSSNNKINFIDIVEQTATSTASAPAAPSGLTATASSSSQINLSWTDNASNESGFYVDRSTSSSFTSVTTATLGANTTSYSSTGLSASTTYYYRVRAYNSGGASANSSSAYATTQSGGGTGSGPTDNPIQTKYGSTSYTWTNDIKWSSVFNAVDYGANGSDSSDDTAAFNAARDAAAAAGGGVVYFPAGTYTFNNDISLKNGVVIRGATPTSTDAKASGYDPATNFAFPQYKPTFSGSGTSNTTAFKKITTTAPQTDSNIGLVNVDVNRAAIKLLGDGLTNTNKNIVVFGVRSNNVAEPDPGVPSATLTSGTNVIAFQNAWQRWSYRFAANIKVQADANVLVANNRVNDAVTDNYEQIGYIAQAKTGGTNLVTLNTSGHAVFNYTNHYGIEVNRSKSGGYALAATPTTEPSLFRTGNVIRDNYVFHTMRIGITGSGDGLQIQGNIIRDQSGKIARLNPGGYKEVSNSATLENRGIDWSGYNVTVNANDVQVFRHTLQPDGYGSIDGEGILLQECCGGTLVNGVTITNNTVNSYISLYKTQTIQNVLIQGNTITGATAVYDNALIHVQSDTNGGTYPATNVRILNNVIQVAGNIRFSATGGSGNQISNNSGNGSIIYPSSTTSVSGNTGFTLSPY